MHTITLSRRARSRFASWAVVAVSSTVIATTVIAAPTVSAAQPNAPAHNPSRENGAVIVAWNETAMGFLTPSGRPLQTQPFVITAMHVAMYDAVVAVEGGAKPFGVQLTAPEGASSIAAAAAAAHRVLVGFLPDHAATFDAALQGTLAEVPDGAGERDGVAVGEAAGWATLAVRLGDIVHTARLFAAVLTSEADALIACWDVSTCSGGHHKPCPPSNPAGPRCWAPPTTPSSPRPTAASPVPWPTASPASWAPITSTLISTPHLPAPPGTTTPRPNSSPRSGTLASGEGFISAARSTPEPASLNGSSAATSTATSSSFGPKVEQGVRRACVRSAHVECRLYRHRSRER